ncbi:MAG: twin-arginine translocation signal domain-containing protein [Nitrospira sp.]|nr:twin-arginine translocation signal domain-containing protein [Nitrospira sp.]
MWATMPSRRSFLQRMGLGVGALGAGLLIGLALPESVLARARTPGEIRDTETMAQGLSNDPPAPPRQHPGVRRRSHNKDA